MNINEYEELLNPKKEEEKADIVIDWPRELQQTLPVIRTGITVGTNESFMSQGRNASPLVYRAADLTERDKLDIMNAAINFINNRARGMPYDRQHAELLSREIHSFITAYMYRWFPRMRNLNLVCDMIMHDHVPSTEFRIIMDGSVHIGTMGVSVY